MVCLLLATGITYGYGYFTGPNCCTPTRTRGKTRAKPVGIPVPVKDTSDASTVSRHFKKKDDSAGYGCRDSCPRLW